MSVTLAVDNTRRRRGRDATGDDCTLRPRRRVPRAALARRSRSRQQRHSSVSGRGVINRQGDRGRCAGEVMAPMSDAMPRPRPPHLIREASRHRRVTWVVRIGHGPRTRLRASLRDARVSAIRGEPANGPRRAGAGTLQWLWDCYRQSSEWSALSNATRRQRENITRHVLGRAGTMPLSALTRAHIVQGREDRAKTPSQANNFLNTMPPCSIGRPRRS
jgi:hypothetical protein